MPDAEFRAAANFPTSSEEALDVIAKAERHRKFVWTPGRILRQAALVTRFGDLPYRERKVILKRLAACLEDLASRNILLRRRDIQSIGYGDEIGYEYIKS